MSGIKDLIARLPAEKQGQLLRRLLEKRKPRSAAESLVRVSRDQPIPLSFAQESLWLHQLMSGGIAYVHNTTLQLRGALNLAALRAAWNDLERRHEIFRTTYHTIQGRGMQRVGPAGGLLLPLRDLSGLAPEHRDPEARRIRSEELRQGFDLERCGGFRVHLVRLEPDLHLYVSTQHHILMDGWSTALLWKDLPLLYQAHCRGEPLALPDLPLQYADYAAWERRTYTPEHIDRELQEVRRWMDGAAQLDLPASFPRPPRLAEEGALVSLRVRQLGARLAQLARERGLTPHAILIAAATLALSRYTGRDHFVIGSGSAKRNRLELEPILGNFADVLFVVADLRGNPSAAEYLIRVRDSIFFALEHHNLPFHKLVAEVSPPGERDPSHAAAAVGIFTQGALGGAPALPGLEVTPIGYSFEKSRAELGVTMAPRDNDLLIIGDYRTQLFDESFARAFVGCIAEAMDQLVRYPERRIDELEVVNAPSRAELTRWNAEVGAVLPAGDLLGELEQRAAEHSGAVALETATSPVDYGELMAAVRRVTACLLAAGCEPSSVVGVALEEPAQRLAVLLGALAAGGVVMDLETTPGAATLAAVRERRPSLLIADAGFPALPGPTRIDGQTAVGWAEEKPALQSAPEAPAWISLENGPGGKVRSFVLPHRALLGIAARQAPLHLLPSDRVAWISPRGTPLAILELLAPLLSGAGLVAVNPRRGAELRAALQQVRPSVLIAPTGLIHDLLAREAPLPGVRRLIFGGEPTSYEAIARLGAGCELHEVFSGQGCLLGLQGQIGEGPRTAAASAPARPWPGNRALVLDRALHQSPLGAIGELHLAGPSLACQEADADLFLPEPGAEPLMIRTGWRARALEDGQIELLGPPPSWRAWHGYQVNCHEVEAALERHPGVAGALVCDLPDQPTGPLARLAAYLVLTPGTELSAQEMISFLEQVLPAYKIPAAYHRLASLPLGRDGHRDRSDLPALGAAPLPPVPDRSRLLEEKRARLRDLLTSRKPTRPE